MTEQTGNNKPNEAEGLAFPLSAEPEIATNAFFRGWDAAVGGGFRRSEVVPEPSTECPQPCVHLSQHDAREGRTCAEHPCTCPEPQGEPSSEVPEPSAEGPAFIALMPPSPETSKRWYSMYCRVCGIEEMMAGTADDPRLLARRDEHNRERHAEPQGEPSDARAKVIDALVMTRLSDFAGTDMGVIEQAADAVLAALRAAGVVGQEGESRG